MRVEIFSMMAAISGKEWGTTWKGDVDERFLPLPTGEDEPNEDYERKVCEVIFRLFNRVDEADAERMREIGFFLPSLSVGDYITLHLGTRTQTWKVASMGFEPITGNRDLLFRGAL